MSTSKSRDLNIRYTDVRPFRVERVDTTEELESTLNELYTLGYVEFDVLTDSGTFVIIARQ